MRIACIGGGPAGLTFALLMKQLDPSHHVVVVERNQPYDTFGWGVVFSDATLLNLRRHDPAVADAIEQSFNHWDDIELEFKGERIRSGGHGFVGIGRKRLLNLLQARCEALGVQLVFSREVEREDEFADFDLVVASDGVNSRLRNRHAEVFQPDLVTRPNRFIWLGTHKLYDAFTFVFEKTEHGWVQAHIYKFDAETSTFIVEMPEDVFRAHGLQDAGPDESIAFCERVFARHLDGAQLMSNARHLRGSAWLNFQRLTCKRWHHTPEGAPPVVLMGDAAHTAHFAIGSGTKLALEDAIDLAQRLSDQTPEAMAARTGDRTALQEVLARYQAVREIEVLRLQNAAWNAMEWFEVCGRRYCEPMSPEQFMYSLLTRSQRISHENLRLRDARWLGGYERWFASRRHVPGGGEVDIQPVVDKDHPVPPMFTPFAVRSVTLKNRVVVSPMAQYSAVDGLVGDYHLVHLGARAMGGAALVMAEMTCVSPEGRITPGCPGLWTDAQGLAWQRIVDHVHAHTDARIGMQLGHAGAKGSTHVAWEGIDQPLKDARAWPTISASPQQYLPGVSDWSRAMTREDMLAVKQQFVDSTRRAAAAGFDWLELHCAHGYLLSSFISPLTNRRDDAFGGPLENRLRFPLEVFADVRAQWPAHLPMSVRISAHDWVDGGITPDDAVLIARAFRAAGADLIDVSSGQVSKAEKPVYGRMFQTPFADRIRNEAGVATIAVGAISEADHVNSIIAAGRADLCAVARPHLTNPAWTLTEAARIGYTGLQWPRQYLSGKPQVEAIFQRERAAAAALQATLPKAGGLQ